MMTPGKRHAFKMIAILLACSLSQLYVQIGMAGPTTPVEPQGGPRLISGRLTTSGNRNILVNGTNMSSGATILTGATIETGDQVGATIDLGDLGKLDLAPNTRVTLDFDDDGNLRVKLLSGCAVLTAKKKAEAAMDTETGNAGKVNKGSGGVLNFCFLNGALSSGSATGAGAGAVTTAATGGGIGPGAWTAIIAGFVGTVGGLYYGFRGGNPSPGSP